jgi:hypothetical protein
MVLLYLDLLIFSVVESKRSNNLPVLSHVNLGMEILLDLPFLREMITPSFCKGRWGEILRGYF